MEYEEDIKVIIFPYLYGNSDNFKSVLNLAKKKNKIIHIEDIAGSFGGKIKQKNILDLLEILPLEALVKVKL